MSTDSSTQHAACPSLPAGEDCPVLRVARAMRKNVDGCIYDSAEKGLSPDAVLTALQSRERVLIAVETKDGWFGSYHAYLPKEAMQDSLRGDAELRIVESTPAATRVFSPRVASDAVPCFFGSKSRTSFGVFFGYWLRADGTYVIDSAINDSFTSPTGAFGMVSGTALRVRAWSLSDAK